MNLPTRRLFRQQASPFISQGKLSEAQLSLFHCLDNAPLPINSLADGNESMQLEKRLCLSGLAELGMIEELLLNEKEEILAVVSKPHIPVYKLIRNHTGFELCPHVFLLPQYLGFQIASSQNISSIQTNDVALIQLISKAKNNPIDPDDDCLDQTMIELLIDNKFLQAFGLHPKEEITWSFHDALFHGVSVFGRATTGGYGATFPYRGILPPPPVFNEKDNVSTDDISLPLAGDTFTQDDSLASLFFRRRSVRSFQQIPLTTNLIGTLLDQSLRVRQIIKTEEESLFLHAFPSGGARGEITSFLIIDRGELASGFYEYCKFTHALRVVHQHEGAARAAIELLSVPTGQRVALAPAAVVFAADYQRMAWKYEGIAYATILRNVGCIYQTLSLSAISMGLGSCALGGGWGSLEESTLASALGSKVIVGAMLFGLPDEC